MEVSFVGDRVTVLGRHQASLSASPWGKGGVTDSLTVILNGHFCIDHRTVPGYVEINDPHPDTELNAEESIGEVRFDPDDDNAWAYLRVPRSNLASLASVASLSADKIKMKIWVVDTPLSLKAANAVEWALDTGDKP